MVIELNTSSIQRTQAAHSPSFQNSFRPTASTISAQATIPDVSKGFFASILDFFKKIFCCCASTKGNDIEIKDITKLIEQGKAKEAAAAWAAFNEQDTEITQDTPEALVDWVRALSGDDAFTAAADFARQFFDIEDPRWGIYHADKLLDFAMALPEASGKSSNPNIQELAKINELEDWTQLIAAITIKKSQSK